MAEPLTIADLVKSGDPIDGKLVRFVAWCNVFTGAVKRGEADGQIVAHGCDTFGPCNVRGPAHGFELIDA